MRSAAAIHSSSVVTMALPAWIDTVAKPRLFVRETRGLSCGRVDAVEAVRYRADAIDANLKFRKLEKQTLSQHRQVALQIHNIELHAQFQ